MCASPNVPARANWANTNPHPVTCRRTDFARPCFPLLSTPPPRPAIYHVTRRPPKPFWAALT
eukprot:6196575-Lingulodinium_polyedra.AAC.1